ncbi:MAG: hypothetical protein EA399_04930 [Desulfovibrionales bacterium]|nr:MAG: hypothetical protein EA399_04930 [Desulfovibrionales bacterium]
MLFDFFLNRRRLSPRQCCAFPLRVFCLRVMVSSLYRLLAAQVAKGYETAKSKHLFQDFINATGYVTIAEKLISVRLQKRAHNPYLIAAGCDQVETPVPWLGNKLFRLNLG